MTSRVLSVALCAALMWMAYGCTIEEPLREHGEIGITYQAPDGSTVTNRDATYEFGEVYDGMGATQRIVIRNVGQGSLYRFTPLEKKTYVAYLKARASALCPEWTIILSGTGV